MGRQRGVRVWGTLGLVALSASWLIVRAGYTEADPISIYIAQESQLAIVTGEVIERPRGTSAAQGAFARFSYQSPGTRTMLRVHSIRIDGKDRPASGDLLLRVDQTDHRLALGQVIEATGWLGAVSGPKNIGDFNYRNYLRSHGVVGRLTLRSRDNWKVLHHPVPTPGRVQQSLRGWCADKALASLRIGMTEQPQTLGLLETMLLGQSGGSSREIRESFQRVGLAHVLSISGAHLGILLWLVWLITRWFIPDPPRAALFVLAVLLIYLLSVPLRVPIVRSAIMAGTFCAAYATGRQVRAFQVFAFSAVAVLLWRPMELFTPGFQLSFAAVGGLILFVEPLAERLWPRPEVLPGQLSVGWVVTRVCVDYLAVGLVAFAMVFPLVAYHFQMVNPLSVLLSVMALPVLTLVLGVGYFKIFIGLFLPSVGLILSGPLGWLADTMLALVDRAGDWPGSFFALNHRPTVAWVFGMQVLVLGLFLGAFTRRHAALVLCVLMMGGWTYAAQIGHESGWQGDDSTSDDAAVLTMFSVGDGSCYLLELPGHTVMFDCGSQQYYDIAHTSILPSLKAMGIRRIDTLVISHANTDHFNGTLDLAERLPVGQVLVTPHLMQEAEASPTGPTAFLIDGLRQLSLPPETVERGWALNTGHAQVEVLWPPAGYHAKEVNDYSMVMRVNVHGRSILLNGDIQDEAIRRLLELEGLGADISDIPHHGSVVDATPDWLQAVGPSVLLQSTSRSRLYNDPWPMILQETVCTRMISARDGMSQVRINPDGELWVWSMRGGLALP